jgi:hypothetical protein
VHAERDAGRVEREEDGERAAGLGGQVRREVVVRDEREAGDPRELHRGGRDGEGEGREEELVHPQNRPETCRGRQRVGVCAENRPGEPWKRLPAAKSGA